MALDVVTLSKANKYTEESLDGVGAIAGRPCQIQSITDITGGHRITFLWIGISGTEYTSTLDVMDGAKGDKGDKGDTGSKGADGLGIKSLTINESSHLIVTYDDDTTEDAGLVSGTTVEANPIGEATAELEKIQVGNTIYSIPEGGGAVASVNGKTGTVVLTASDVGALPDNTSIPSKTSDLTNNSGFIDKSVNDLTNYTTTTDMNTALGGKVSTSAVGTAGGIAELDNTGKVPSSQLPSYVDDVVDGYYKVADGKFYEESTYETEIPGETGKIYISVDTDIQYRWTGSAFSALGGALTLGETSSTAYRGDRGKTAYDDSQTNKSAIGTLSNLLTTAKSNLVAAINELFNGKQKNITAGNGITKTTGTSSDTIAADIMPSTDMSEIVTPLPGVKPKWHTYSEEEQAVGTWIDGKTVYQKTFVISAPITATAGTNVSEFFPTNISIDKVVSQHGILESSTKVMFDLPMFSSTNAENRVIACTFTNSHSSNPNKIQVTNSNPTWNEATIYYTLQYTKS